MRNEKRHPWHYGMSIGWRCECDRRNSYSVEVCTKCGCKRKHKVKR